MNKLYNDSNFYKIKVIFPDFMIKESPKLNNVWTYHSKTTEIDEHLQSEIFKSIKMSVNIPIYHFVELETNNKNNKKYEISGKLTPTLRLEKDPSDPHNNILAFIDIIEEDKDCNLIVEELYIKKYDELKKILGTIIADKGEVNYEKMEDDKESNHFIKHVRHRDMLVEDHKKNYSCGRTPTAILQTYKNKSGILQKITPETKYSDILDKDNVARVYMCKHTVYD